MDPVLDVRRVSGRYQSTLDLKFAALYEHKSQVSKPGREWDFEKFMRKRHAEVGKRGGYRYAESFKRITV